ncbi:MAG: PAS domain S-box protein [Deltaproteobacteria bacterium]|nr:PAS domain S-box protein [Deltaproteobacteria bacterium]
MRDNSRSAEQYEKEIATLRCRIAELEDLKAKQKTVEAALRESEALYRTLIEMSPDVIVMYDFNGKIITANSLAAKAYGVSNINEMLRELKSMYDILAEDSKAFARENLKKAISEGQTKSNEYMVRLQDGTILPVEVSSSLVRTKTDKPYAVISIIRDISERKIEENELRKSEEKYKLVVENAGEAIFVAQEGRLAFVNQATMKLSGHNEEELVGSPFIDFIFPDDRQMVYDNHLKRLRGEYVPPIYSFRIITKDGEIRWVEIHAVNIVWNNKEATLNFLDDITERKQAEDERNLLQDRLQRAQKMEALGMLAGGVAHDLNNVLGILVGYSELLLLQLPGESPLRNHVNQILNGGQRAAAIIQDLLTMTRRGVVTSEILSLNRIIEDYLQTPEFDLLKSHYPGVVFKTFLDKELLNLKGSPIHLTKTVMNLIVNAAEAVETKGEVLIKTENRYVDKPIPGYDNTQEGDYAVLGVSDTGSGISAVDLSRIFEPFYTKKVMGRSGTGLGLAVVWGTVKDHGGYIDVTSEDGKGSEFTAYFPATREKAVEQETAVEPRSYAGHGEHILVVDDVEDQRMLASAMLEKLGYNVTAVASGEEAVDFIKKEPVDLVILDMIMDPGIDGLETYRRMVDVRPGQKAVIVSGFALTNRVSQTQELGAGPYVKKPYLIEKLGMTVRKELDK